MRFGVRAPVIPLGRAVGVILARLTKEIRPFQFDRTQPILPSMSPFDDIPAQLQEACLGGRLGERL